MTDITFLLQKCASVNGEENLLFLVSSQLFFVGMGLKVTIKIALLCFLFRKGKVRSS